jgi:pimeloyl-ACP methyl ester carboxylesterase
MAFHQVTTEVLNMGYEAEGPLDGPVVMSLHGWPDDVRAWRRVAPLLHAAGLRTIHRTFADSARRVFCSQKHPETRAAWR